MSELKALLKQLGPPPEYPEDPLTPKQFVVQAHFRGRSVHLDWRFSRNGVAEGWTVSAAQEGKVKVPVVTFDQAKKVVQDQEIWKFDLETGLVFPREVETTIQGKKRIVIRPGSLYAERKAQLIPKDWLMVEGVTPYPPDWPETILEFWDEWPNDVKRELKEEGFDKEWAQQVLEDGSWKKENPEIPVGATRSFPGVFVIIDSGFWMPGARKPWMFEYFLSDNHLFSKRIMFRFVARTERAELILPPGVEEERPREPGYWLFTTPDPRPYVLSEEAIEKEWLPPVGVAALPLELIKMTPPELRFWEEKDKEKRLKMREELAEHFSELWKDATLTSEFKLFNQTFRGQIVIRFGPSTSLYWLLFRQPKAVFALQADPRLRDPVAGIQLDDAYWSALWTIKGTQDIEPGTLLNPTKETPSKVSLVDEGELEILEQEPGFLRFQLHGKELKGTFRIVWETEDSPIMEFSRVEPPETKKSLEFKYLAKNEEKQLVYGVVLSPHGPDATGDLFPPEIVETAAHQFLVFGRQIGLEHEGEPIREARVVESYIAPQDLYLEPDDPSTLVRKGEWVLVVHISDPGLWEKVKAGEFKGFSIQGWGVRESLGGGENESES